MKIITRMVTILFFVQVTLSLASAAEQLVLPAPDIEAPTILFGESNSEIAAGKKIFSATVTDNVGIANVTLYFKRATDTAFAPKKMQRSNTDPDLYTTDLYLDPGISDRLELYVRADDVSGNSVFEGQKFSPLTFTVVSQGVGEAERVILMSEAELKKTLVGNTLAGNSEGNTYIEYNQPDGLISGLWNEKERYKGEWTIEGKVWCYKYEESSGCNTIAKSGNKIYWYTVDGTYEGSTSSLMTGDPRKLAQ